MMFERRDKVGDQFWDGWRPVQQQSVSSTGLTARALALLAEDPRRIRVTVVHQHGKTQFRRIP